MLPTGKRLSGYLLVISLLFLPILAELKALPPYISLSERVKKSDIVIIGDVVKVSSANLNTWSKASSIRIKPREVLKGKHSLKEFSVNFITFPESHENKLRKPPKPGSYFIFLNKLKVKDVKGREGTALVLYRPHPFAFELNNAENGKDIRALLGKVERGPKVEKGTPGPPPSGKEWPGS